MTAAAPRSATGAAAPTLAVAAPPRGDTATGPVYSLKPLHYNLQPVHVRERQAHGQEPDDGTGRRRSTEARAIGTKEGHPMAPDEHRATQDEELAHTNTQSASDQEEGEPDAVLIPVTDGETQNGINNVQLPLISGQHLQIGRGEQADLELIDDTRPLEATMRGQKAQLVHCRHASIELRDDGGYYLHVYGNTMMTTVNTERFRNRPTLGYSVPPIQLADGDLLAFGGTPSGIDST